MGGRKARAGLLGICFRARRTGNGQNGGGRRGERGGGLFARLKARRIAILSYHKHPGADWSEDEFLQKDVTLQNGEQAGSQSKFLSQTQITDVALAP